MDLPETPSFIKQNANPSPLNPIDGTVDVAVSPPNGSVVSSSPDQSPPTLNPLIGSRSSQSSLAEVHHAKEGEKEDSPNQTPPPTPNQDVSALLSPLTDKARETQTHPPAPNHDAAAMPTTLKDKEVGVSMTASLQGAWAKPLPIHLSSDSSPLSTLRALGSNLVQGLSSWPSLSDSHHIGAPKRSSRAPGMASQEPSTQASKDSFSGGLPAQDHRFPWAAKINPKLCNLHRVTTPEYMEDGTPKVIILNHVFLKGFRNQREFVLGQFYRCSAPSGGLIHAVLNRVWGRNCRIFIRKLSESYYLFHIPDESTRSWVLQRGLWHVDNCLLFVAPWTPTTSLELPEISTIPVWVTLNKIPANLYSILGIDWIASALGEPMLTHKPRLDPTLMGEAKILVEIELDKPFAQKISAFDTKGNVAIVDVEYSWIPSKYEVCGLLGHKKNRCLSPTQNKKGGSTPPSKEMPTSTGKVATASASVLIPDKVFAPGKDSLKSPMVDASSSMHSKKPNPVAATNENTPLQETIHTQACIPETRVNIATVSMDQEPGTAINNFTTAETVISITSSNLGIDKSCPASLVIGNSERIDSLPRANVENLNTPSTTNVDASLHAPIDLASANHMSGSAEDINSNTTTVQPSIDLTASKAEEPIPIVNAVTKLATTLVGPADSSQSLPTRCIFQPSHLVTQAMRLPFIATPLESYKKEMDQETGYSIDQVMRILMHSKDLGGGGG